MTTETRKFSELPVRVKKAIEEEQRSCEIIIGWVQVGYVVFMLLLYTLTPKGFHGRVAFEPVPLVLGAYAPFVIARIILAHRVRMGFALLSFSAFLDSLMLTALIGSYHLQYNQPPAFALRAPTFLMFFAMIALRALRYEAKYILISGLSTILGWCSLVFYVYQSTETVRTRSFIEYVSIPNTLLVGAEIERIIGLALVTVILFLGSRRSRRLLLSAVIESHAKRELSNYFAPQIVNRIVSAKESMKPGEGEIKAAAILFMDLRGFTKLSRTAEPSVVLSVLGEYQERMVNVVQSNGGVIDKYMGDGILAHFGAATNSKQYAAEALRTIEGLLKSADEWNEERRKRGELELNVGVSCATGNILFGAIGNASRLEFTVIGDAVNLAAKLEKHTKACRIRSLTTLETLRLAESQGYQPLLPLSHFKRELVPGVMEPLDIVGVDVVSVCRVAPSNAQFTDEAA